MSNVPKFCSQCGAPLQPGAAFCSRCGRPVAPGPATPAPVPSTPAPSVPAEPILAMVPGLQQRSGFMGLKYKSFNLIVTPYRLVLAFITDQMMKEAVTIAREEAKAQGKGWLGQAAAQMGWLGVILRRYQTMTVEAILALTPGSFFIPLNTVRQMRFKAVRDQEDQVRGTELHIETTAGKYTFTLVGMSEHDARNELRRALGNLVK